MGWKTCCVSFETLRKETGLLYVFFFLESPRECVWENLCGPLESPQREGVQHECGTGLCDHKCHGKSVYCSQPDAFFCSSGPVIHLHGRRLTTLCNQWAEMPTQVHDTTFCCPQRTADLLCAMTRMRVVERFDFFFVFFGGQGESFWWRFCFKLSLVGFCLKTKQNSVAYKPYTEPLNSLCLDTLVKFPNASPLFQIHHAFAHEEVPK